MALDDKIYGLRLRVTQQAAQRGVSQMAAASWRSPARWRQCLERYGVDALHPGGIGPSPADRAGRATPFRASRSTKRRGAVPGWPPPGHRWGVHVATSTI